MADKQMTGKEMPGEKNDPAGMSDPRDMLDYEMSRRGTSPVLVGRVAEMAALSDRLERALQGGHLRRPSNQDRTRPAPAHLAIQHVTGV